MWVLLVTLAGLWGVFMALAPRAAARLQTMGYKHREAHEPSDGYVKFLRVLGIILALLMFAVFLPAAFEKELEQSSEQRTPYETEQSWQPTEPPTIRTCEPGTFLCDTDGTWLPDKMGSG